MAATVVAVFAVTLPWTGAAGAAQPSWTTPVTITAPGSNAFPQVAVTSEGHASMVWLRLDGVPALRASSRSPGGTWSAPVTLVSPAGGGQPSIASDRTSTTAVWIGLDNTRQLLQAARRTRGAAWSAAVDVSSKADVISMPVVASNRRGDAVAVWAQNLGGDVSLQASRRSPSGTWSTPLTLSAPGESPAGTHDVAISATGAITATWVSSDGADLRIAAAYRPPSGPWQAREFLSASGQDAERPAVAMAANGDAVLVWSRRDGTDFLVQAVHRPADGYWQQRQTLSAAGQDATTPVVAVDGQGLFTVVWTRSNGSVDVAESRRRSLDGAWSPVDDLSPLTGSALVPAVIADGAGNVTATWQQEQHMYAARRPAGGPWEPAAPITTQTANLVGAHSRLALDQRGNVTATWGRLGAVNNSVVTASLDVAGPTARVVAPVPAFSLGALTVTWRATDEISAISSYRTRVSTAPPAGPFTTPSTWKASTTATTATYTPTAPGGTYCFSARATDAAGHVGAFSAQRCSAVPLDDRTLKPSAGWTKTTPASAYRGTALTATSAGRTLTSASVLAKRVALVANRGPGAGSVDVFLGATKLKRISLAAPTTKAKQVIAVATFATPRAGKVRIVTVNSKPVTIDGLGVSGA